MIIMIVWNFWSLTSVLCLYVFRVVVVVVCYCGGVDGGGGCTNWSSSSSSSLSAWAIIILFSLVFHSIYLLNILSVCLCVCVCLLILFWCGILSSPWIEIISYFIWQNYPHKHTHTHTNINLVSLFFFLIITWSIKSI